MKILYKSSFIIIISFIILIILIILGEHQSYTKPQIAPVDITNILKKENWSYDDYNILTIQTGLTQISLDILKENDITEILDVQKAYLSPVNIVCTPNMMLSRTERLTSAFSPITALENGDVLITPSSHVLGFRNGHCAIVVDAENGITLEAAFIGRNSEFNTVDRFKKYSSVAVYRLRDTDAETRSQIAQTAAETLINKPYSLFSGILDSDSTHCSYLVWSAFNAFGYDLDSNGGKIVTPSDIAKSPLLELKQVYGLPLTFK